jgi:hypothetical protein
MGHSCMRWLDGTATAACFPAVVPGLAGSRRPPLHRFCSCPVWQLTEGGQCRRPPVGESQSKAIGPVTRRTHSLDLLQQCLELIRFRITKTWVGGWDTVPRGLPGLRTGVLAPLHKAHLPNSRRQTAQPCQDVIMANAADRREAPAPSALIRLISRESWRSRKCTLTLHCSQRPLTHCDSAAATCQSGAGGAPPASTCRPPSPVSCLIEWRILRQPRAPFL